MERFHSLSRLESFSFAARWRPGGIDMTEAADEPCQFKVRARHEDVHHGRVVTEPTFEAAAIAYVGHMPLLDQKAEIGVIVRDVRTGDEHSFLVHHGRQIEAGRACKEQGGVSQVEGELGYRSGCRTSGLSLGPLGYRAGSGVRTPCRGLTAEDASRAKVDVVKEGKIDGHE
jgi:hypothetical protein